MGASPQLENGFTRIADELLEALTATNLTARQYRIVLAIVRKTYGFGKKRDAISASQLSAMTKIPRSKIPRILTDLARLRIITIHGERKRGRTPTLSLQKDHTAWGGDAPQMGALDAPQKGASQNGEMPPFWLKGAPQKGALDATPVGSTQERTDTLQEREERAVRFGGLVPLLALDEVDRWIAVLPHGVTYSRDQVQAWFLRVQPVLVAAGKEPLSTARAQWTAVTTDEVRRAVLWVEQQALAATTTTDHRERDAIESFDAAFFS